MQPKDFPLAWPIGYERTLAKDRIAGKFRVDFATAYDGLFDELKKLHDAPTREFIISTAVPLSKDGRPLVSAVGKARDPGVAVYFWVEGKPFALPSDIYDEVHHNMRALTVKLAALRSIARHGGANMLSQSMTAFARELPEADKKRLLASGK